LVLGGRRSKLSRRNSISAAVRLNPINLFWLEGIGDGEESRERREGKGR